MTVDAESDQTLLLAEMTGGGVQDSEIAALRVRSELLFLEEPDDQLHPGPRPRTAMGLHSASIRITEFGKEKANPQPRAQQGESSGERGRGGHVPNQYLSPSRLVSISRRWAPGIRHMHQAPPINPPPPPPPSSSAPSLSSSSSSSSSSSEL